MDDEFDMFDEEDEGDYHFDEEHVPSFSAPSSSTSTTTSVRMAVQTNKAGMENIDTLHVNKVMEEESRGSRFYANANERDKRTAGEIEDLLARMRMLTSAERRNAEVRADARLAELDAARKLDRTFMCLDMDYYYCQVEERDRPELRGRPVAVGGKAMLSTSNYEARKHGVRAAMPGYIGKKLCPELLVVPARPKVYQAVSDAIFDVCARYDEHYRALSLDECIMDVTDYLANDKDAVTAEQLALRIQREVFEAVQLTCSIGVGCNSTLAKIAANQRKPNGVFVVESTVNAVVRFMRSLSVRSVNGIGKVTAAYLAALGIESIEQLFERRGLVVALFSERSSSFFLKCMRGCFNATPNKDRTYVRKSVGRERTRTMTRAADILAAARDICESMVTKRDIASYRASTITVKMKTVDFETITRARTLARFVVGLDELWEHVNGIVGKEMEPLLKKGGLRLIGVRLSGFDEDAGDKAGRSSSQRRLSQLAGCEPSGKIAVEADETDKIEPCPICGEPFASGVLMAEINAHIDRCLQGQQGTGAKKRKKGAAQAALTTFFGAPQKKSR